MVKCNTCGGTYEPVLPDGMEYYHACPPLAGHEITAGLEAGTVRLTRKQRDALDAAIDLDARVPVEGDAPTREALALAAIVIERPNRRDENVTPHRDGERARSRIKAEGAGVVDVPADV